MELYTVLYLFIIISLGYFIGNLKVKGFYLDISAILIIALIAGHFGVSFPSEFKYLGLAFFIYAVGLQSGPGFFENIKKNGLVLNLYAFCLVTSIFLIIFIIGKILKYDNNVIAGIFTGIMSSAPALAATVEISNSHVTSVIFGIVYPFGTIVAVLLVRMIPILLKSDAEKEVERYRLSKEKDYPKIVSKNFRITNENFNNKIIRKSQLEDMSNVIIERIETEFEADEVDPQIHFGDIVRVTGRKEHVDNMNIILGEEIDSYVDFHDNMKVLRLLVSNKNIVGKKISEIKELFAMRVTITKVRRSGIDFDAKPQTTLLLGDKLYITVPQKYEEQVTKLIGDNLMAFPAADFLPISVGIVIGILVGFIPLSLPFLGKFKLSFIGGILITSLILGRIGRTGPVVWQLSPHSTTLLKTFGQLIYMATIGTSAGKYLVEAIKTNGLTPIFLALFALIVSLTVFTCILRFVLKMNMVEILGLISGGMTSTPSLTMSSNILKSDYPAVSYAAVYPFSLILTMLLSQILIKL
ncbi:YidE/YbjL duplication [Deferribacterales bacterium Es71-Z0220]|uniref:aspartate:alanine exchanger family transporter n=1 Tax=Deferrivibrio essentukiensis TaxID=2880922 RepID=UPI001F610044|nr:TrkA C-terminal domain-containing protein [Deferrivibrio essentukiensis]MCB4204997.1 YidE/YbjL duplication [Deferrivibrio essentukiensis]